MWLTRELLDLRLCWQSQSPFFLMATHHHLYFPSIFQECTMSGTEPYLISSRHQSSGLSNETYATHCQLNLHPGGDSVCIKWVSIPPTYTDLSCLITGKRSRRLPGQLGPLEFPYLFSPQVVRVLLQVCAQVWPYTMNVHLLVLKSKVYLWDSSWSYIVWDILAFSHTDS